MKKSVDPIEIIRFSALCECDNILIVRKGIDMVASREGYVNTRSIV